MEPLPHHRGLAPAHHTTLFLQSRLLQVVGLGALGPEAAKVALDPLCRMLVSGRWLPSRWVAVAPGVQPTHSHGGRAPRSRSAGRTEERTKDLVHPVSESVRVLHSAPSRALPHTHTGVAVVRQFVDLQRFSGDYSTHASRA